MEELPRHALWIALVEEREEGRVREVLQAGGVIGHDIVVPVDEEGAVAVAVVPLVAAAECT